MDDYSKDKDGGNEVYEVEKTLAGENVSKGLDFVCERGPEMEQCKMAPSNSMPVGRGGHKREGKNKGLDSTGSWASSWPKQSQENRISQETQPGDSRHQQSQGHDLDFFGTRDGTQGPSATEPHSQPKLYFIHRQHLTELLRPCCC